MGWVTVFRAVLKSMSLSLISKSQFFLVAKIFPSYRRNIADGWLESLRSPFLNGRSLREKFQKLLQKVAPVPPLKKRKNTKKIAAIWGGGGGWGFLTHSG